MHITIDKILNIYTTHTEKLIILIGVIELCKVTNSESLEHLVNSFNINRSRFENIQSKLDCSSFRDLLEGEYFDMWLQIINFDIPKEDNKYRIV